jgi:class 3 adenylate cyclase/ActR/RegA family two-component response regulator
MSNILIVDDKEDNLKAYKLALEDAGLGWNILTAKNEKEAQKILTGLQPIDVIITDLVMLSEQSGIEVLRLAKQKDPLVMVIILTAFEKILDRFKAFEMGAFDCLSKGVPGVKTGQEIIVKTKTALSFRDLALDQIKNQKKLAFLKRYFDPKVFGAIEQSPELLNIQSRTLTVVFWDIRGFSALCETLKAHPILIAGFLREYFQVASDVIFKHQGVLDKFVGDGVMALFGAINGKDTEGRQDAINAAKAAIEMKVCFEQVLKNWMEQWALYTPQTIDIGLGCGVHTGETLVGNVGTENRDHFTALGPHVNFAKRIESRAIKEQILISASTKARIVDHFELTKVDTISDVKNIPGIFDIFEIVKIK